jgi:4-amino-4-deoxy-L-arabinose transferase-like glycosyltransferase
VAVATLVRFGLAFRAPVLIVGDSETYLGPALDLERLQGFDLMLKRTPGYPLVLAGSLALFGEDLRSISLAQHGLGALTSLFSYLLALRLSGRLAGVVAGLATALAGNLVVYERLVMTETLFTFLLVLGLLTTLVAVRSWVASRPARLKRVGWMLAAGLLVALATLVRPVAQPLVLLPALGLLLAGAGWRQALLGGAITVLGFALPIGAWSIRPASAGEGVAVGALGQTLVGRTARHDRRDPASDSGFVYFDPDVDFAETDPVRYQAKRILQEAANRGTSGRAVHTRLRKELGLSDAAADRLMRDLALEAIGRRPGYYLVGTGQRFLRLWVTGPERLTSFWNDRATIIRAWEDADSRPLLDQPAGPLTYDLPTAELLVSFWQPAGLGPVLPALFLLGCAAALLDGRCRLSLLPAAAAVALLLLSAALVGGVARYRYPEDPLIFVVAATGVAWLIEQTRGRMADSRPARA